MSQRLRDILHPGLEWLGSRSRRELALLWIVFLLVLVYLLGNGLILESYRDLKRERIRLNATRVLYEKLELLLERRDEIMAKASGLVNEYLQSQDLDASTLLLSRIDRKRTERSELVSVYPLRDDDQLKRFRVKLIGPPGDLARLFFALGEGAPPIILRELSLSSALRVGNALSATSLFEIEQRAIPEEWIAALADSSGGPATEETRGSRPRPGARLANTISFPYKAIDRHGIFQTGRGQRSRRLETAAPTIQSLMQNLSLSGVIWGEEPKAIIEDLTANQTHYRTVGQFIGELEVIEITRSAVTLRYKEEEGRLE